MKISKITAMFTVGLFALMGFSLPAKAQQSHGAVDLTSIAHATSRPLSSYQGTTQPKGSGELRLIPLRRPEMYAKGGNGAAAPSGGGGGNWSDADLQSSYGSSKFTIGTEFAGMGFTGYLPPDENLTVGINSTVTPPQTQILEVVNANFAVRGTAGQKLAAGDLASVLFGTFTNSVCSSEDGGDPIALYDQLDQRWIISQLAYNSTLTDNHLCLAISQTSDATGVYNLYDIPFGSNLPDYPKLGVWSDGIYFSANIFLSTGSASTLQFTGAQACSFPRSDVTGSPSSITFTCSPGTDTTVYNILPADLVGSRLPPSGAGPDYFLQFSDNLTSTSGNLLRLYQLNGNSLDVVANLTVNDFHEACGGGTCIPQNGTTELLDSLGDRLMYRLSYRNYGSYQQFVVNHSVQVNSGSQQSGIRWYALRNNSSGSPPFLVYKESTFSPDATYYRWMGSIAQDKNDDLGIGYSLSGTTSVPGIAVTGLLNGTDTGMEQEQRLYNGSDQSYEGTYSRWGDYTAISVDPTDDCTFWYTNEYITPPLLGVLNYTWQTVIGSFSFPGCSGGATGSGFTLTPSPSVQNINAGDTATYSIAATSQSTYDGTVNLTYSGCPSGATCTLDSSVVLTAGSSQTASLSVSNTGSLAPGNYSINITGTDSNGSPTYTTSVGLTINSTSTPSFSLAVSGSPQSVTQGSTASFGITLTPSNGFSSSVALSVTSGCSTSPSNACSFSPSSVTVSGGSATSTLSVATDTTTTAQTYTINISASGGGVTQTAQVSLTVNTATSAASFSLAVSGSPQSVTQGSTASFGITLTPSNGYSNTVTLTASNCPTFSSGAGTCSFSPSNSITVSGGTATATLNVPTDTTTTAQTYVIGISATDGSVTQTAQVSLTVNAANSTGSFSLSASPGNVSLRGNSTAVYTVTVTPSGGFNGSVTLSVSNGLPPGATYTFTPNPWTSSYASSTLAVTTLNTPRGSYTLTIQGTSGSLIQTTTVSLKQH